MKKETRTQYIFALAIVAGVLILAVGVVRANGYILTLTGVTKGATLTVESALPGSTVFVDERQVGTVDITGAGTFTHLKPGVRNVIIGHIATWPWVLDIDVNATTATIVVPLQVQQNTPSTPLLEEDADKWRARTAFATYRLPTAAHPLEREGTRVWVSDNTIVTAPAGESARVIYASTEPIRQVLWFTDRSDAVVAAAHNSVFALDLREGDIQNFLPIYTGIAPEAVTDPEDELSIFVRDFDTYNLLRL